MRPERGPPGRRGHAGRRDRRSRHQPRRERRRGHGVRRGRARPPPPGPAADPLRRARRAARGLAAAPRGLGGDDRADAAYARHRAPERERRVVGGRDDASPRLRARLVVPTVLPRVDRAVHADGTRADRSCATRSRASTRQRTRASTRWSPSATPRPPRSRRWLDDVTPERLAAPAPMPDDGRWPPYATGRSVRQCLGTVLDEEWAHHGFCVRDLDLIEQSAAD